MKKICLILLSLFFLLELTSCVENSKKYRALQAQLDSIQNNYGSRYNGGLDEAFATLNEVEEGLKSIRESENMLSLQSKDGIAVPEDSRQQIESDMASIQEAINQYKIKISQLEKSNKIKSAEFKKRLKALYSELEQKSALIENLQKQLEEKDTQLQLKNQEVSSLSSIVSTLKKDVGSLKQESPALKEQVSSQEKEIYSAYYIIGTKGQLIDAGVMTKGGLFKSSKISYNAEKSAFVKIDYREITTINTNATRAKVLSIHPKGTYALEKSGDEVMLTISDPDAFWEQTKYLVIQVQ